LASLLRAVVDLRPLREHRVFRRLWLGTTASGFGGQLSVFAVIYYVWERTGSPAMVGLIGLFTAAPLIGFALLGTAFADHVDRRRLALGTTAGQIANSLLMTLVAVAGAPVWVLLVLVGVSSGLAAVGAPARRAVVPRLLPPDRLAAGLALNHLSFQLVLLLGPAAAGLLTAQWGSGVCFAGAAVASVAALVGIAGLPATGPAGPAGIAGPPGLRAVWEGIRFTGRTPAVRGALLADLAATGLAMPVAVFPVINEEKFGGAPEVLGLFFAAVGAGGILASAISGIVTRHHRPGMVLLTCGAVWGASLAAIALASSLPAVLGLLALAGAADTWAVVSRGTVVQSSTPESHRGRVAALEHVAGAAGPHVGNLRAGLVAAGTSGGASLAIGGAACVAGIGLLAAMTPALRQFTVRPVPDPS
jgi:MFS family permease